MKHAGEYLSIIRNPKLVSKLRILIDELLRGATLEQAARNASLDAVELEKVTNAIMKFLEKGAPGNLKPPEKASRGVVKVIAYSDGASRGNPGEAACSALLFDEKGRELARGAKRLGKATNNVAEYKGVIMALEMAVKSGAKELELRLDSELVVKQLKGEFKVKNEILRVLNRRAALLVDKFSSASIKYIPRERNSEADALANAVLDGNQ